MQQQEKAQRHLQPDHDPGYDARSQEAVDAEVYERPLEIIEGIVVVYLAPGREEENGSQQYKQGKARDAPPKGRLFGSRKYLCVHTLKDAQK